MTHLDLFSGIGGFAYAIDQVWDNVEHTFCDNDKFCQQVLKKHWPNSKIYGDIREITTDSISTDGWRKANGNTENEGRETSANRRESIQPKDGKARSDNTEQGYDIVTGGFPCQPFSQAGKRRGTDDNRYLWPEMFRVIQLTKPTWVVAENVYGILNIEGGMVFEQVCTDLEGEGFEVQAFIIPAVSVNAPHRRDRVWFIAHRTSARTRCDTGGLRNKPVGKGGGSQTTTKEGETQNNFDVRSWNENWIEIATEFCGVHDELSDWVDRYIGEVIRLDDGKPKSVRRTKGLQALWGAIQSEKIWKEAGGLFPMATKEVLLQVLCQLSGEAYEVWIPEAGIIAPREVVSGVWGDFEVDCSPQERRHNRQRAEQLTNIVPELSHETALEVMEAWHRLWGAYSSIYSQEIVLDGFELSKAGHRKERLKSLGNAIVPQVAIEIMKAIKHTEGN